MKKIIVVFCLIFIFTESFCFAEQIDINTATLSQLDQLTGIGPAYAQRIIDGRPYSSIDDLDKVKGIGPATLQKIKDQGLACVNCVTKKEETRPPEPIPSGGETAVLNLGEVGSPPNYSGGVIINEILPSPQGADEENEFIELYNKNNFDVDLSGWKLQDTEGAITISIIPNDTKILANNFLIFKRPDTKISLNNSGDTINLLFPNEEIASTISFTKAPIGQSYNLTGNSWSWSTTPTPASKNIISKPIASTKATSTKNASSKNTDSADAAKIINENLASLSGSLDSPINSNPWPLFLIVLGVATVSAFIILILKLKFSKNKS